MDTISDKMIIFESPRMPTTRKTGRQVFASPTGVVEAMDLWEGIPGIPDIWEEPKKSVRFARGVVIIPSEEMDIEEEDDDDQQRACWTKEEIKEFQLEAKREAKAYRESHSDHVQSLASLYQECKDDSKARTVLHSPSAQEIMRLPATSVRGLEGHLHVSVPQHRIYHQRSLLAVQRSMQGNPNLDHVLRTSSLYTSRGSRTLARLLAHGDYVQVRTLIQQELEQPCL